MGYKPVPTALWIKWLKFRGLEQKRKTASHVIWDMSNGSLLRPIVFRTKEKTIPGCHIHTNLKTLGVDYDTFISEISDL
jgi:hypothetical protein